MKNPQEVRVRIGPSPTGDPHVGTAYISLFNYAFAKKHGGKFILRIEDTDAKRSKAQSEQDILDALRWLGLSWDEGPDIGGSYGPYRQSERLPIYRKYAQELLEKGGAYHCFCTNERLNELRNRQNILKQPPGYDGHCRNLSKDAVAEQLKAGTAFVLRLKTPESGAVNMVDLLRGPITINCTEVDDQVLLKSDGWPTYHLANVVDDHEMGITHVIRGEEWISSLPKHVLLYEAFGWQAPQFCHLPLLRNADKSKVSKRKNPVSLKHYRQAGYLAEATLNFLGLMAYSMEDGREIFSLQDFVNSFDLQRVSLGGPVFDLKKFTWVNGEYLRQKTDDQIVDYLCEQLFNREYLKQIIPLVKERIDKSEDFIELADFFFRGQVGVSEDQYLVGGQDAAKSVEIYESVMDRLESLDEFKSEPINLALKDAITEFGLKGKDIFMPLRMMVSGKKASPPLFETMAVLGKERCRTRMRSAIDQLKKL
jgi:glutamyl-tRNA synthetase